MGSPLPVNNTVVVPGTYGQNRHLHNRFTDDLLDAVARGVPEAEILEMKQRGKQAKHDGDVNGAAVPIGMAIGRIADVPTVDTLIVQIIDEARATALKLNQKQS